MKTIDGYVADTLYPSSLHQYFQPAWIDWNLKRRGLTPPRCTSNRAFTLVDLGCGDGLGLVLAAASYPQASFIGVDAMPEHVERGMHFAKAAGLGNLTFHCATFADAAGLADGTADYVTAQGVLSWVNEANRALLMDLAARWLTPGGTFTVGYNCYPGWNTITGFQRVLNALCAAGEGSSEERLALALETARAANVLSEAAWQWFHQMREKHPANYFIHEFLNDGWNPAWSGDVIRSLETHGLHFVSQIRASEIRREFSYSSDHLESLSKIANLSTRELASDILTENWFRHDLYMKLPWTPLKADTVAQTWLAQWWALCTAPDNIEAYRVTTPAGELDFDGEATRSIIALLSGGPAPLTSLNGFMPGDLINAVDALFCAKLIIPVDPAGTATAATRCNRVMRDNGWPIGGLAGTCGPMGIDRQALPDASESGLRRLGIAPF
ncbi:MAG: methyltransferase domain-containing protein [Novosphingobium sp.]|nr:methyltransferase domain-containing protein [Novosphingobium sp.]